MATRQSTIDALLDQLAAAGPLTTRKMFGEYCLYLDGTPVALVFNDRLYVKPTAAGRAVVPNGIEAPPFPKARPYLLISADDLDSWSCRETICRLLQATYDALPAPQRRHRKRRG